MSEQSVFQAGDFNYEECSLLSSSGVSYPDFEKQVVSIILFENIFQNSMHGQLTVIDTNNLPMNMPLTGQDYLTLKIKTPNIQKPIVNHVFCITQLMSRSELSTGAMSYTFKLISPEALRNNRVRVQSSYTDTPSEVIEKVFKDVIKSTKNITIEKTNGIRKYVSPYSRPFDFIKDITRESISSKSQSPNYLFYENTKGFFFVTTDYLYNQGMVAEFEPSDMGLLEEHGKRDVDRDYRNMLSYVISDSTNTVAAARGGMLGGRLVVYNIFNKNYEVHTHDYFRDFDNFSRISKNPIYNETPIDDEGKTLGNFPNSNINLHPTSKSDGLDARYSESYNDNQSEKWLLPLRSKLMELNMGQNIGLSVHGRADLAVGDKIQITLPITGKSHGKDDLEKFYEGEFLVTHLKHIFDGNTKTHMIEMSVAQDSTPQSYEVVADAKEPKIEGTINKV